MKKKWIMILLAAVLLAVLVTVIDTRSAEDQLPPMAMVWSMEEIRWRSE